MLEAFKIAALAGFINVPKYLIEKVNDDTYRYFDSEFMVVTEEEADLQLKEMLQATAEAEGVQVTEEDLDAALAILLKENDRAWYLAVDQEENEEECFYIYRMN